VRRWKGGEERGESRSSRNDGKSSYYYYSSSSSSYPSSYARTASWNISSDLSLAATAIEARASISGPECFNPNLPEKENNKQCQRTYFLVRMYACV
jgi:hypothetical protein